MQAVATIELLQPGAPAPVTGHVGITPGFAPVAAD